MIFKTNFKHNFNIINLTPLVDVIFLMLIFFMITSDILPLKSLNVENPSLNRNSTPITTQVIVIMDQDNIIYIGSDREIINISDVPKAISKRINNLQSKNPQAKPTIVLSVDKDVSYGLFLKLFSSIQDFNANIRLAYQTAQI